MKIIISVFLSLGVCFNLLPLYSFASQLETTMEDFYSQLDKIILDYEGASLSSGNIDDIPKTRLIVKTKDNSQLERYYNACAVVEGYDGLHILQYSDEAGATVAYNSLQSDEIEYVEYDYYWELDIPTTQSETTGSNQSHITWNSYAVNVDEAFDYIENKNIVLSDVSVAVLDSGIHYKHEFFNNSDRIIDSGYYYSISVGIDSEGNIITEKQSSMEDDCFHGTAVSSVIFDNTMNNAKIKPYRITNSAFHVSYSEMFKAFDYAVSSSADIINISAAGGIPGNSKVLYDKIIGAVNNGIIVIVASGNDHTPTNTVFPACHPNVITVSATDENSLPAYVSNFGDAVDISAPGVNLKLPVPRLLTDLSNDEPYPAYDAYMTDSGTSYSAPLVAAAAATLKSIDPDITPAEVERIIKETAYVPEDWEESCDGKNYGTGIVNFYNMVKAVLEPEYSEKPKIIRKSDGKYEIVAPEGSDARIYYTINSEIPTIDSHLLYSEPLGAYELLQQNNGKPVKTLVAVCHENGKLISEPVKLTLYEKKEITINYKKTKRIMSEAEAVNSKWLVQNPDIVSADEKGNITGKAVGDAVITVVLPSGEKEYYNITVEYAWWQQIIRILLLGVLWY